MQRRFCFVYRTLMPTTRGPIIFALFIPLSLLLWRERYRASSLGCWCRLSFLRCLDGFSGRSAIGRGSFSFGYFSVKCTVCSVEQVVVVGVIPKPFFSQSVRHVCAV